IGIDDDRVLAAHFENRPFNPHLAKCLVGGDLVDPQSHFARTRKCDVASFGMGHNRIPKAGPRPGAEVDHGLRHTGFFEQFDKFRSDSRRVARRLQNHGEVGESLDGFKITVLPETIEASVMPAIIAHGKFHGGITAPTPSGMYRSVSRSPAICTGSSVLARRSASRL